MKVCAKCHQEKDVLEFGKDIHKSDGLSSYCKECIKQRNSKQRIYNKGYSDRYSKEYREKNREILREKAKIEYQLNWEDKRKRANELYNERKNLIALQRAAKNREQEHREKNRIRQAEYRKNNKTKLGSIVSGWKKRNPHKAAAHTLVLWACRTGIIKKSQTCEECGAHVKTQGHHEDYSKPLQVVWLCKPCHSIKHRKYR